MTVHYEANPRQIQDWFDLIERTQLVLPRFQRMEAWGPSQITEVLDSVIRGMPVGSVLVLQVAGKPEFSWRALEGAPETGNDPILEMLLDGQQRLTALWRALTNDYEDEEYFVKIIADDESEEEEIPYVVRVKHYERNGKRYPLWTQDEGRVFDRGLIPAWLLHPDMEAEAWNWAANAKAQSERGSGLALERMIVNYRDRVRHYEIPYIRLRDDTPIEAVLHTFIKLNTQGTPLSAFDLIVARMEVHDIDLHSLSESMRSAVPQLRYFSSIDDIDFLRALVLLEGRTPTQRQILNLSPSTIRDMWEHLENGARRALSFLQQEGVPDSDRLPTEVIIPALVALWTEIPQGGLQEGQARTLLRSYMWRAFFSDRYERSANTSVRQDYSALRDVLLDGKETSIPIMDANLPDSPESLLAAGWPRRRDRLARAILLVFLLRGARDIHDGSPVSPENVRHREYHHVFPKKYLETSGVQQFPADVALNVALITWLTNRRISATNPRQYLLDATSGARFGEEELRARLDTHLIPYEPFVEEDYEGFLRARADRVYDAMTSLVNGRDWGLGRA